MTMPYGSGRYISDGEHVTGFERGSAKAPDPEPVPCPPCGGDGQLSVVTKGHSTPVTCGRCFGKGVIEP